ncbi:hypothetical protein GCM10025868_44620 [Angustibacter aerolatus]|uniref:Uncharacterized protein n=1 Tax=Angustibacter aerolatus TaxID=1162965 RepID=A0ABQ6JN81_9ACTN|nr:hypothetical protein GCM10025868_44620 [Angustibacter aerolatus]
MPGAAAYLGGDRSRPTRDQVVAVHVLTHETRHVAGVTTENAAECGAVQRDAVTARLLGATAEQAVALARSHWTTTYPRMPDAYRDGGCAPGARWTSTWPRRPGRRSADDEPDGPGGRHQQPGGQAR